MLDGVDWVEEASRSSLDSKLWICSFCESKFNQAWLRLSSDVSVTTTCACVRAHLERIGYSVVVPRLLGRQAFMGGVAAVGEPRPLLKGLHALLRLLWDRDVEVREGPPPGGGLQPLLLSPSPSAFQEQEIRKCVIVFTRGRTGDERVHDDGRGLGLHRPR